MKQILVAILITLSITTFAQTHSLEKIWETDAIIAVPESVLPQKNFMYVTLIDGAPWGADGRGGVAKLTLEGKIIDTTWITGLNAPKGMAIIGKKLYVADMDEVIVIDIKKGEIKKSIKIEGAQNLNDVTADSKKTVYVSDSKTGKIWVLKNDAPTLYMENMSGVNGLRAVGKELYIASGKTFVKADANKQITKIADLPEGGDGVEPVGNGDFIVTSWIGYVYYVSADGKVETLLDSTKNKKNTADIGYDAANRIVYLPTFNGKTIAAYRLK